jgi:HEAT repeat protein
MYVLWGVALNLLLAATLFCWLVVVPVWRVSSAVESTVSVPYSADRYPRRAMQQAVQSLGSPRRAADDLLRYLRLPQRWAPYRLRAVAMLGFCGDGAVPELLLLLDGSDHNVRAAAARALGETGDKRTVEPLITFVREEDVDARVKAAHKWAAERNKTIEPGQLPFYVDASDFRNARLNAIESLGRLGDGKAAKPLEDLLSHEDTAIRQAAADALKKIKAAQEKR